MFGHLLVNSEWFLRRSMFLYLTWHGQDRLDHWVFGSTSASFWQGFSTSAVLHLNRTCCAERQHHKWEGDADKASYRCTTLRKHIERQDITLTLKKRHGSNSSILHVHCRFQEGHRHGLCIVNSFSLFVLSVFRDVLRELITFQESQHPWKVELIELILIPCPDVHHHNGLKFWCQSFFRGHFQPKEGSNLWNNSREEVCESSICRCRRCLPRQSCS